MVTSFCADIDFIVPAFFERSFAPLSAENYANRCMGTGLITGEKKL